MDHQLFDDIEGWKFFQAEKKKIKREIDSLTEEELRNSDDFLKIIFISKFTIKPIEFGDYYQRDMGEIKTNNGKPGRKIEIHLPFSNDRGLFKIAPSKWYSRNPRAKVSDELIFTDIFYSSRDDPESFRKKIEVEIALTKRYSGWLNENIRFHNNAIENIVESALGSRRKQLQKDLEFLDKLEIPKRDEDNVKRFVKPIQLIELKIKQHDPIKSIDPSIELETYNQIIDCIDSLGISLERSSKSLRDMDENPLRDTFVMGLNASFKGMVTSEAFHTRGLTDIVIKHGDNILFLAECKIWRGDQTFIEGIDQLLDYLTLRDSKTSYIIFSRNQNFKEVTRKSKKIFTEHKNYSKLDTEISKSSFRYVFKQKRDESEKLLLTLHLFDLGT